MPPVNSAPIGYAFDRPLAQRLARIAERFTSFAPTMEMPSVDQDQMGGPLNSHIYIAKAPAGGIAAMSGTTPGSAVCTLYTISAAPALAVTSPAQTITVYNIGLTAVPANAYIPVKREILTGKFIYQNIEASANYKPLVRFTLAAALATSDASKTATITNQYGPGTASPDTGAGAITVNNLLTATGGVYVFSGASGAAGLAMWDSGTNYRIIQMECPA